MGFLRGIIEGYISGKRILEIEKSVRGEGVISYYTMSNMPQAQICNFRQILQAETDEHNSLTDKIFCNEKYARLGGILGSFFAYVTHPITLFKNHCAHI